MSKRYRFGAVIPAAGLSSRMGAFKPLLPYSGGTVIGSAIGSALPFAETAAAVTGYRSDELCAVLKKSFGGRLVTARNPDYAVTDMLSSVRIGLRALGECDAFFLLPADIPAVSAQTYEALIQAFDGSAEVIYPVFGGRRGHPPLISAALIPDILAYEGEGGLRAILSGRSVREISVDDGGILRDLDTPEDYMTEIRNKKEEIRTEFTL